MLFVVIGRVTGQDTNLNSTDIPLDTNVDIAVVDLDEADFDLVALVDFEAFVDLEAFFFVNLAVALDPLEAT